MHSIDLTNQVYLRTSTCLFLGLRPGTDIAMQIKHFATKVFVCDKYFQADVDPASLK